MVDSAGAEGNGLLPILPLIHSSPYQPLPPTPATGEDMILDHRRVVSFKCSGKLREKLNPEEEEPQPIPRAKRKPEKIRAFGR